MRTNPKIYKVVEVEPELYFVIKEYSILTGLKIKFLINKAVKNFCKAKKLIKG